MPARTSRRPSDERGRHGATQLAGVRVDAYNLAIRDTQREGFVGDRASATHFIELLDEVRRGAGRGGDPFGPGRGDDTDKDRVDAVLRGDNVDAAHLVHLAAERYAQEFADVVQVFRAQPDWDGVERLVIGGGFHEHAFGGLAVRRAMRVLAQRRVRLDLHLLRHEPDDGGLLGWIHAAPREAVQAHAALLAVDIGGTHVRCGLVEHGLRDAADGSAARVVQRMRWRHGSDEPTRDELVARIAAMLNGLAAYARSCGIALAPVVGVACPGRIAPDGGLEQGTQNLPGDWGPPFHLPDALHRQLDRIDRRAPEVLMHNDAVIQGLSERPAMHDVARWAVFTVGTGLGNAVYTNG